MKGKHKYQLLVAYRDLLNPGEWAHLETIRDAAGINRSYQSTANAAYNAYKTGTLDKHSEKVSTYRINPEGVKWLEQYDMNPRSVVGGGPKGPRKAKTTSTKVNVEAPRAASNGNMEIGSLLEVVARHGDDLVVRSLDNQQAYRLVSL